MPTLLQINTTLNLGSTGRIAEQISLMAEANGWDCYIAHGARYVNQSKIKSIQIGSKITNVMHAIKGEYFGMQGFGSTLSTYRFINQIQRIKPDIIHLHNLHGYYINIAILFKYLAKANIPIVWTLHDCWSFTGHCTHFENQGCYKWETECGNCPLLMLQYKSRLIDRSKRNFKIKKELYSHLRNITIVPVSNWLGSLVKKSILKEHRIKIIRNGIDLNLFKPIRSNIKEQLKINGNKKIVLGVVDSGFKGKKEFIALSKDSNYQVVIVGVKKDWMNNIPDNIICVPRTNSQKELAEYYSAADVFINPTQNDTFPTTNIESIACGTPVVTYNAGGSPEILDNNTGIVVNRNDIEALHVAIETILTNGKGHYVEVCRNRAVLNFNKDERYKDYLDLYSELTNRNSNQ